MVLAHGFLTEGGHHLLYSSSHMYISVRLNWFSAYVIGMYICSENWRFNYYDKKTKDWQLLASSCYELWSFHFYKDFL